MNSKKLMLVAFFSLMNFSVQAFTVQDVIHAVAVFIGLKNPTEVIDGLTYEILSSKQANGFIASGKMRDVKGLKYKKFVTVNEVVQTEHIVDGETFKIDETLYIVRTSLFNNNQVYKTKITFFGYQQIILDSNEAIAIINDTTSLRYVSMQFTGGFVQSGGKIWHGKLENGSTFTADGIHYLVGA